MGDGNIHPVTMPKWGLAMREGTIVGWQVSEGASVAAGEPLCDIETAKIANEFDSPFSGTLARILKPENSVVQVGELIAVVVEGDATDAAIDEAVALHALTADDTDSGTGPAVRTAETNLGRIAFLETGDAGARWPVLFLHGFGGDHTNWELLQAELRPDLRAIAIDLPGHGGSGDHVGTGSARDVAKAVLAFMDAQELERVDLVAHSFGASVAAAVAAARPESVASLAVIAPPAFGAAVNPEFVRGYLGARRKKDMKPLMEMLFSDPGFVGRTMVNDAIARLRGEGARAALTRVGESLLTTPLSDRTKDLAFLRQWPALIIWGNADRIIPIPEALPEEAGDMLTVFEGAGHMPHAEAPAKVAARLQRHLEQVR